MNTSTTTEVVFPKRLTPEARQHLVDELFVAHDQVFHDDKEGFVRFFMQPKAAYTAVRLRRDSTGSIVSYVALHRYDKEVRGIRSAIFRVGAGALRNYRGHDSSIGFALRQALRCKVRNPTRPIFYLGALLHPTSYLICAKYGDVIWPNYRQPLPPDIKALMVELSTTFGYNVAQPDNPLVVQLGSSTRETEEEQRYWRTCDKPEARFFVQNNPNYSAGYGLLTLAPINAGTLLRVCGRIARDRVRRRLGPPLAAARQLPLLRQLVGLRTIRRMLARAPLCAGLPPADLTSLARTADLIMLPAGRDLFHAGDASDDLYVIVAGAVYVVVARNGEERIVDQFAAGALFGEFAMLSGEPRTATIRMATRTSLIRLKRQTLLRLMDTHPILREAIWTAYRERRFADLTSDARP